MTQAIGSHLSEEISALLLAALSEPFGLAVTAPNAHQFAARLVSYLGTHTPASAQNIAVRVSPSGTEVWLVPRRMLVPRDPKELAEQLARGRETQARERAS